MKTEDKIKKYFSDLEQEENGYAEIRKNIDFDQLIINYNKPRPNKSKFTYRLKPAFNILVVLIIIFIVGITLPKTNLNAPKPPVDKGDSQVDKGDSQEDNGDAEVDKGNPGSNDLNYIPLKEGYFEFLEMNIIPKTSDLNLRLIDGKKPIFDDERWDHQENVDLAINLEGFLYNLVGNNLVKPNYYEVEFSLETRYISGYLDQDLVSELYDLWETYEYEIRDIPPSEDAEELIYLKFEDLVDVEEIRAENLETGINKNKITGRLLYFILNLLDNGAEYLDQIAWYEYTDDSKIEKEIAGKVPIIVIAQQEIRFNKELEGNVELDIRMPAFFTYSYYIEPESKYLKRNLDYLEYLNSFTTGRQVINLSAEVADLNEAESLNSLSPMYFSNFIDVFNFSPVFDREGTEVVRIANAKVLAYPTQFEKFNEAFIENDEQWHYYLYNEFMNIYLNQE